MAVRKREESKVVVKQAGGTYLDVRIVHKHEGYGKARKIKSSEYGVFHTKHRVYKDGFKNCETAVAFIEENFSKYDRKGKKFNI